VEPTFGDDWRQRSETACYVALDFSILMTLWRWAGKDGYFWGDPIPLSRALWTFPKAFLVSFFGFIVWDRYLKPRGQR
jgi:hypothetical protein